MENITNKPQAGGPKPMGAIYTPVHSSVNTPWQDRKFCPRARTLFGTHKYQPLWKIIPIRCKCWSCDYCAPLNAERLYSRVLSGKPEKFITLTTRALPGETPGQCARRHRPQIARLLSLIRKHHGPIECAILLELTRKGQPHWHLAARCGFIPQHWLSDQWAKLTGSKIVDIRKIHNPRNTARYIAKYTIKTARHTALAKLGRVYSFTSAYLIREQTNPPQQEWRFTLLKDHPLDVLRKSVPGKEVRYRDGFFELLPSPEQKVMWEFQHFNPLPLTQPA